MNLEKYIKHSIVDMPMGVIPYLAFDYDNNNVVSNWGEADNKIKSINLGVNSKIWTAESISCSCTITESLEQFGLNTRETTIRALMNEHHNGREKRIVNLMKELGEKNNQPKLTRIDKLLKYLFKYEKIRNVKNLLSYIMTISNFVAVKSRMGKPSFIIVGRVLAAYIHELEQFINVPPVNYIQQKNNGHHILIGSISNLNLDVIVSHELENSSIIFGSKFDEMMPGIHLIEVKNPKFSKNPDLSMSNFAIAFDNEILISGQKETERIEIIGDKISYYKREALFAIDKAELGFYTEKISMVKRTFWTFIWDKIKNKFKWKK